MNKSEKAKFVADISEKFKKADATFVAECEGIEAVEMNAMRKAFRDASVELRVVRNTLAKRAVSGSRYEHLAGKFTGSTAIAFSYKDAAAAAKVAVQFAKDQPKFKIKAGSLGDKQIGIAEIKGLAELPPRGALLGKFLGSMKAPTTGLVMVLGGVPRKFLYALVAIKDVKSKAA
ncbi:MAG: 50S ribosomal protein L10 [Deltaproteobacteria bacterium]|nr:50S ribosomal protein L10 [Deltaproteobacteria bacterium]